MVEQIIKNFCPKLSNFSSKAKSLLSNNSLVSKYKAAIQQYLDIVDSRQSIVDAFISAFSSNPEVSAALAAGEDEYDTRRDYAFQISEESRDLLLSMFSAESVNTITFTDSGGYPFSFIKPDVEYSHIGSVEVLISTQNHPTSTKDCLLYIEDGVIKFNPIIRICDFYDGSEITSVVPRDVKSATSMLCSISFLESGDSIISDLDALNDEFHFTASNDILYIIKDLADFLGLDEPATIDDIVLNFSDYALALINYTGKKRVYSSSIYGLVKNLVHNNELIDVIRSTYENVVNGNTDKLIQMLQSYADEKAPVVKKFVSQIVTGFSQNGILGALGAIVDLLKSLFSSQPSGYKVFNTENSIPQAFSAGLVAIITGAAQTLFQILSGVMQPVVAVIGGIGYGIFSLISNVISANISDEYARVDDLDSCENISPYALFGSQLSLSEIDLSSIYIHNDEGKIVSIKDLLDWGTLSGNPLLSINWISCVIKIGYVDPVINDSGDAVTATSIVVNIFPSVNSIPQAYFPLDSLRSIWRTPTSFNIPAVGTGYLEYADWQGRWISSLSSMSWYVSTLLNNSAINTTPTATNDDEGQYAGYAYNYDFVLRTMVYRNALFTFALFFSMMNNQPIMFNSGSNRVPVRYDVPGTILPTISLDGSCHPYIELMFGALAGDNVIWVTVNDTQIWMQKASSSYESLGKALTACQNNILPAQGLQMLTAVCKSRVYVFTPRDTYKSNLRPCGPLITFRGSYVDKPYFTPPKYTRGSVVKTIVIGALITITAAVTVAISTVAIKRAINKQRAIRQANVEHAWSALTSDASAENYDKYRKTVKANNRFARVFGGTKYDYVNYWNGDTSSEEEEGGSIFEKIFSSNEETEATTTDLPVESLSTVINLIKGSFNE